MELKSVSAGGKTTTDRELLIAPYGIEIWKRQRDKNNAGTFNRTIWN